MKSMDGLTETMDALQRALHNEAGREPRKIVRDSYTWREYIQREGQVSESCYRSKEKWTDFELERLRKLNMALLDVPMIDVEEIERDHKYNDFSIESPPMDARVGYVLPSVNLLYHLTPSLPRQRGMYMDRLVTLMGENGVIGNPNEEIFTFLKDRQTDVLYGSFYPDDSWSMHDCDVHPIRFEIVVDQLLKYRSLFHDSLGLSTEESDHNYVVFGGIPIQTIRAIEALDRESGEIVLRVDV